MHCSCSASSSVKVWDLHSEEPVEGSKIKKIIIGIHWKRLNVNSTLSFNSTMYHLGSVPILWIFPFGYLEHYWTTQKKTLQRKLVFMLKTSTICIIPRKRVSQFRAVARSENLGGHIVLGGDNVPPRLRRACNLLSFDQKNLSSSSFELRDIINCSVVTIVCSFTEPF